MADQKISQLTGGGAAQATDEYVVARAGGNNKITGANVAAAATSVGTLTSLSISGQISSTAGAVISGSGASTSARYVVLSTTGGDFYTGIESSAGGSLLSGSSAYARIFGTSAAYPLEFFTNNVKRATIDASGNLGLGVTPSAWSVLRAMDINTTTAVYGGSNSSGLLTNAYYDGVFKYKTTNTAGAYEIVGNQHRFSVAPSGTAGNNISFTQAMTLDASGNLAVGPFSPVSKLDVNGSIQLRDAASAGPFGVLSITPGTYDGGTNVVNAINSTHLRLQASGSTHRVEFYTGATERARITSGGYFKASSNGTYVSSTGLYHELRSADNAAGLVVTNTSTSYTDDLIYGNVTTAAGTGFKLMRLDSNSVEQFRVRGDGTIFAQNTTVQSLSDVRLKENISDAAEGLAVITALRPVRYDWKAGYGNDRKNQLGFIAQEVEAVFPEAVSEWSMDEPTGEVDEDGKPITEKVDYKTVGPGALIPVLVKAIQELEARIAVLEAGA